MRFLKASLCVLAATTSAHAYAATATFTSGFIGGYTTNSNVGNSVQSFSQLGITKVEVSDGQSARLFTAPAQGNDLVVQMTVYKTDGSTITVANTTINWTYKEGGVVFGIGAVVPVGTADGYTLVSPNTGKTYILEAKTIVPNAGTIAGSADNRAVDALNAYVAASDTAPLITDANGAALASAFSVNEGTTAAITPVKSNETVTWTLSGPDASKFTIDANGDLKFVGAPDYENPGDTGVDNVYNVTIEAVDAGLNKTTQAITVTVLNVDEVAPLITDASGTALASAYTVDSGSTAAITPVKSNETVTWSLTGPDASKFQLDANGNLVFVAAPDYENPGDAGADNVYNLTIEAVDAANNKTTQTITVTVRNLVDPAPLITDANGAALASAYTVDEGSTAAITPVKSNETVTWTLTGPDASKFKLDANGNLVFVAAPDYENPGDVGVDNVYNLTIEAVDAGGNKTTQAVAVTVRNLDDTAPLITDANGAALASAYTVDEGSTAAITPVKSNEAVTWTLTGPDASKFKLDANGNLVFVAAPDYENPGDVGVDNVYNLTIEAVDGSNNKTTKSLTVTVRNLDEVAPPITDDSGTVLPAAFVVKEGSTAPVTPLASNETVTWSLSGPDASKFQLDANGNLVFIAAPDFENAGDDGRNNVYNLVIEAVDGAGNKTSQPIIVTVQDIDEVAPQITDASGAALPAAFTVKEGTTAPVTPVKSNETVTWSLSGPDASKFKLDANGNLVFVAAPDFESAVDTGRDNVYNLTLEALDASGNKTSQPITVTVQDIDEVAPLITDASGAALPAAFVVNEGTTAPVTPVKSNEAVVWTLSGTDADKFRLDANGNLVFVAAPDYENALDAGQDNVYNLTLEAVDTAGNRSTLPITVTVRDIDDTAPLIQGPSGTAGAGTSGLTLDEGKVEVTTMKANEPVTWSISGGPDKARLAIDPKTGAVTFLAAPDFENPTDADGNNTYVIVVRAVDAAGNVSEQTVTITIANVDEIARKLAEIGSRLRGDLRNYAFNSLNDMLSFNEGMMQDADDGDADACAAGDRTKALSGRVNANANVQDTDLRYAKALTGCDAKTRVYLDAGFSASRSLGNWNIRTLASVRFERKVAKDVVVGLGVLGSMADDTLNSFASSSISDKSLQVMLYSRARLSEELRFGVFAGLGKAWYDFGLTDGGMVLDGEMTGKRRIIGTSLSGDISVRGLKVTTDIIVSHAAEKLNNATLAAAYLGEKRSGIAFAVGTVDSTRLSMPLRVPFTLGRTLEDGAPRVRFELSPGLLCQDNSADVSTLACGYQIGGKLTARNGYNGRLHIDFNMEAVNGTRRNVVTMGYAHRFGPDKRMELGFDVNRGAFVAAGTDTRTMVRLRFTR